MSKCSQKIKLIKMATDLRCFLSAIQTQFPTKTKPQPPITDAKLRVIQRMTRTKRCGRLTLWATKLQVPCFHSSQTYGSKTAYRLRQPSMCSVLQCPLPEISIIAFSTCIYLCGSRCGHPWTCIYCNLHVMRRP